MVQCLLMPIIVEVDLYKFDPYDLLKMAFTYPVLAPDYYHDPPAIQFCPPSSVLLSIVLRRTKGKSASMMMEESWTSIWTSVRGWFTPTVLFLLLNLVIGTIAVTSKSLRSHRRHHRDGVDVPPEDLPPLSRGPSAMLERIRSIGLYRFRSGEISIDAALSRTLPEAAPLETVTDPPEASATHEDNHDHETHQYGRSRSDTREEAAGKLAGKMKKSASASSAFDHFEAAEIVRRPATARGGRGAPVAEEVEEVEVDARADDFINRFRQQLHLQRLDSILRYKEMLNRGK
ncbi:unnamed protein product [Musa banksii]